MEPLSRVSARCITANFRTLDLGQDSVKMPGRAVGQPGKVPVLQGQEAVGEVGETCDGDKQTTDHEDGLVVRLGRTPECPKIPSFVNEADMQRRPPEIAMATRRWP